MRYFTNKRLYEHVGKLYEEEENEPTDKNLWDDVLAVTKGEKSSVSRTVDGEEVTVESPNDGSGFETFPSAYASGWAVQRYEELGGEWKEKTDEVRNIIRREIQRVVHEMKTENVKNTFENVILSENQYLNMKEELDQWFDEKWVDISRTNDDGEHPECGESSDEGKRKDDPDYAYPKCVPKSKADDLTKDEKERLVRRKRDAERNDEEPEGKSDEPTMTSSDPDDQRKKEEAFAKNVAEKVLRELNL